MSLPPERLIVREQRRVRALVELTMKHADDCPCVKCVEAGRACLAEKKATLRRLQERRLREHPEGAVANS